MELCLLPQRECTTYINQLLKDSLVETQTLNSKGSNILYYSVNHQLNLEHMVLKVYKIILNMKIYLSKEIDNVRIFESEMKQEEFINKIFCSISELDDIIITLSITQ
jgi:hypothetical protein